MAMVPGSWNVQDPKFGTALFAKTEPGEEKADGSNLTDFESATELETDTQIILCFFTDSRLLS